MNRQSAILVLILLLCAFVAFLSMHTTAKEAEDIPKFATDQEAQQQIARAIGTISNSKSSAIQRWAALGAISDLAKNDEAFFTQLFLYYVNHNKGAKTDAQEMAVFFILYHLDISESAIIKVLMSYLNAKDENLRRTAAEFLDLDFLQGPIRDSSPPNFGHFKRALGGAPDPAEPEASLVKYMYQKSPGAALIALLPDERKQREGFRDVLFSEHAVSDAIWKKENGFDEAFQKAKPDALEQLTKLSKHREWWVRLYVAEIMSRHPKLSVPAVVQQLKADKHQLIKQTVEPNERLDRNSNKRAKDSEERRHSPKGGPAEHGEVR